MMSDHLELEVMTLADQRHPPSNNGTFSSSAHDGYGQSSADQHPKDHPPHRNSTESQQNLVAATEALSTPGPAPASTTRVILSMVGVLGFSTCMAFTAPCLQLIGPSEVPTLELIIISYGIQVVFLMPFICWKWQDCKTVARQQVAWLLCAGVMVGLALLWIFQASMTLSGSIVSSLGQLGVLVSTVVLAMALKVNYSKVLYSLCGLALIGVLLLLISSYVDVDPSGSKAIRDILTLSPLQMTDVRLSVRDAPENSTDMPEVTMAMPARRTGIPIYSYCSLVAASFLLAAGAFTMHRRCGAIHVVPLYFWLALVGTALALLEMMLFTALWPSSMDTPHSYLPCAAFIVLYNAATMSLNLSWRHTTPAVFAVLCGLGCLVYRLLVQSLQVFEDTRGGHFKPIGLAGAVVLLTAIVACFIWQIYDFKKTGTVVS